LRWSKLGGYQFVAPPLSGETSEPATVLSFSGLRTVCPLALISAAQFAASAYFDVSRCSPVTRSRT